MPETSSSSSSSAPSSSRGRTIVFVIVAIGIVGPGGYGFVEKFIQFIRTLHSEEGGGFAIIPIANYLIVTAGFTCLLVWAIAHGMFRDIEKPKYTMLRRELELEEAERKTGAA